MNLKQKEGYGIAGDPENPIALWPLGYLYDWKYDLQEDGEEYRRHRGLWRLWHDESVGRRRAVDVFPFITYAYDRDEERESLSWGSEICGFLCPELRSQW